MSSQARRAPYAGTPPSYIPPASNAALLIDFDNVTVSIRGDLGKELKALLNSDVIRGKVSVQRAYADWRRYPQYIVPLAENSVDLIFAPAYGPGKKNATDLRMAIDAMELVFTRPEIGTFILLTGDSDFSSCVLKLKEYGKYVIGVGMRESSSDLLIQNCDEYYSYHALSGLTRTRENDESREDPWELVRRAAERMVARRDSMRTDRLKQVMLELDPAFDEGKLGYSKFTRFVTEAADKGLLRMRKGEGGQYEIVMDGEAPEEPVRAEAREPARERGRRDGRGRDRERAPRPAPVPMAAEADEPQAADLQVAAPQAAPAPAPVPAVAATDVGDLNGAYALLQHTVREMLGSNRSGAIRDGDVKRRMLDLAPDFDETRLGFSKFTRFVRQAHDAQVIDLRQLGEGAYEVALPTSGKRLPAPVLLATSQAAGEAATPEAATPRAGRGRGRRGGRPEAPPPLVLPGQGVEVAAAPDIAPAPAPEPELPPVRPEPVAAAPAAPVAPLAPLRTSVRGRRGGLGRAVGAEGPPPLLPGQVIAPVAAPAPEETPAPAPEEQLPLVEAAATTDSTEEAAEAPAKRRRSRGGRGRSRKPAESAPAEAAELAEQPEDQPSAAQEEPPVAEAVPVSEEVAEAPPKRRRSRGGRTRSRAKTAPAESEPAATAEPTPPQPTGDDLPADRAGIEAYLTGRFKGVGKKTVDALYGAFGDDVLRIMENNPDRIRRTVEGRRIDTLLREFAEARRAESAPVESESTIPTEDAAEAPAKRRRSRGGRGRSRTRTEPTTSE
ncbi:MAG: NYN domain-containing protein [Gemmatimonadetes bacterium]|nr:NYN domain-containing protein [Gemmatimonadota bacterium]